MAIESCSRLPLSGPLHCSAWLVPDKTALLAVGCDIQLLQISGVENEDMEGDGEGEEKQQYRLELSSGCVYSSGGVREQDGFHSDTIRDMVVALDADTPGGTTMTIYFRCYLLHVYLGPSKVVRFDN